MTRLYNQNVSIVVLKDKGATPDSGYEQTFYILDTTKKEAVSLAKKLTELDKPVLHNFYKVPYRELDPSEKKLLKNGDINHYVFEPETLSR
jgi:hypothetical protein